MQVLRLCICKCHVDCFCFSLSAYASVTSMDCFCFSLSAYASVTSMDRPLMVLLSSLSFLWYQARTPVRPSIISAASTPAWRWIGSLRTTLCSKRFRPPAPPPLPFKPIITLCVHILVLSTQCKVSQVLVLGTTLSQHSKATGSEGASFWVHTHTHTHTHTFYVPSLSLSLSLSLPLPQCLALSLTHTDTLHTNADRASTSKRELHQQR